MMLPPKPTNSVFGIEIDGKRKDIEFTSMANAEAAARGAVWLSHNVLIFDKVTGQVVKRY